MNISVAANTSIGTKESHSRRIAFHHVKLLLRPKYVDCLPKSGCGGHRQWFPCLTAENQLLEMSLGTTLAKMSPRYSDSTR